MTYQLISEKVDIYQLPQADLAYTGTAGATITIGDLHSNTIKLIFLLIKHGIASHITPEQYQNLVRIVTTPANQLTAAHLALFIQILNQMEFADNAALVRLIGDEMADRIGCDYFTLKLLQKLREQHVPVEILVSNHGIEFIKATENQNNFHASTLTNEHALSLEALHTIVEKKLVSRDEIIEMANEAYKPLLKAISYTLSEGNQGISIFSHAGIGLNTIASIAKDFGVDYADNTPLEIAQTIDQINLRFQAHVQANTLHTLFTNKKMMAGYSQHSLSDESLAHLIWNRRYNNITRPAIHKGYKITYIHGHDENDANVEHICNLDNMLGKAEWLNNGIYTVIYSANLFAAEELLTAH